MTINTRRNLFLSVGFVLLLLTGLIYAWSIFIVPLENEFGWDRAETSTIFSITMASFCLGSMINGFVIGKTSPRFTLCAAAILFFIGFFFASRTDSLWQIFLSYGVFVGLGVGIVYNTIISTIAKWFPDKKGFASGVSLMGFGLGGFILGTIASKILEVSDWRIVFVVFAIAFPVLVLGSSLLIRNPKEIEKDNLPLPKLNANNNPSDKNQSDKSDEKSESPKVFNNEVKDVNTVGMLKTPVFWIFFLWSLSLTAAGLIVIGHAATIAEGFKNLPLSIPATVGLVTIFNGLARVCFGMFFDRFGLSKCIYAVAGVGLIASLSMMAAITTESIAILILAFILTGAFYGGTPTTNSTFVMAQFGQKNFAANFSVVNLNLLIAPTLGTYVAGVLWTSTGTYLTSTMAMIGYASLAIVLSIIINRLTKR